MTLTLKKNPIVPLHTYHLTPAITVINGNNKKVMDYISMRLDMGNVKFGKEMPLDGTYDLSDALEEVTDMAIYLTSYIMHLRERYNAEQQGDNTT